jgi:hypothetical protein
LPDAIRRDPCGDEDDRILRDPGVGQQEAQEDPPAIPEQAPPDPPGHGEGGHQQRGHELVGHEEVGVCEGRRAQTVSQGDDPCGRMRPPSLAQQPMKPEGDRRRGQRHHQGAQDHQGDGETDLPGGNPGAGRVQRGPESRGSLQIPGEGFGQGVDQRAVQERVKRDGREGQARRLVAVIVPVHEGVIPRVLHERIDAERPLLHQGQHQIQTGVLVPVRPPGERVDRAEEEEEGEKPAGGGEEGPGPAQPSFGEDHRSIGLGRPRTPHQLHPQPFEERGEPHCGLIAGRRDRPICPAEEAGLAGIQPAPTPAVHPPRRGAPQMDHPGLRDDHDRPSRPSGPPAPVHLLGIHEIALIETPDGLHDLPADQETRPGNPIHRHRGFHRRMEGERRTEEPAPQRARQQEQLGPQGGEIRGAPLRAAVRVQEAPPRHSDLGMPFQVIHQGREGTREGDGVRVQQQEITSPGLRHGLVVRGREPPVVRVADQPDLRVRGPQPLRRAILGAVVHHPYLVVHPLQRRREGLQATGQEIPRVIGGQDHGDRRPHDRRLRMRVACNRCSRRLR